MSRGRADLCSHGAAYGCSSWRAAGYALLGRERRVTAERNDPDVLADERLSFGALAEADLQATKRSLPVLIRRSPDRAAQKALLHGQQRHQQDRHCYVALPQVLGSGGDPAPPGVAASPMPRSPPQVPPVAVAVAATGLACGRVCRLIVPKLFIVSPRPLSTTRLKFAVPRQRRAGLESKLHRARYSNNVGERLVERPSESGPDEERRPFQRRGKGHPHGVRKTPDCDRGHFPMATFTNRTKIVRARTRK